MAPEVAEDKGENEDAEQRGDEAQQDWEAGGRMRRSRTVKQNEDAEQGEEEEEN